MDLEVGHPRRLRLDRCGTRTDWLSETYLRKVDQPRDGAVVVHHQASRDRRS